MKEEVIAIIPARYASTRLPGKPLLEIAGRPMIVHVAERALASGLVTRVIVAVDDERIATAVEDAGFEARMTSPDHRTGTDRLAEVARSLAAGIIVNVQGDEPLLAPSTIDAAVEPMLSDTGLLMSTTSEPVETAADLLDPNVVKVVVDANGDALYFSRSPIPFPRDAVGRHGSLDAALLAEPGLLECFRRHTGLYAYRREFLLELAAWPTSRLESLEALEQLRALEAGVRIRVAACSHRSFGVDTTADLERVRRMIESIK